MTKSSDARRTCPENEVLVLVLHSADTVAPDLAAHIETCVECQKELDLLTAGSKLVDYSHSWDAFNRTQPQAENQTDRDLSPAKQATRELTGQADLVAETLGGYHILGKLGQGGMGLVYEAEDTLLKRRLALKVMTPSVAANPQNRLRFLREARAVARVSHDHICPIYQVGEANGIPFIAMPLLKGEALDQRLLRQPLTLDETLQVLLQAAEGLAAAHAAGLVHRDIKPSNIWLEERPAGGIRVRLLDFGLARCEVEDQSMTLSGTILGTPAYMAPEQARGEGMDHRADLFSLGAVAYEMITGKRAFTGTSAVDVLSRILTYEPPPLVSLELGIPEFLSKLVTQLLHKNPAERTPSAQDLIEQIRQQQTDCHANAKPRAPISTGYLERVVSLPNKAQHRPDSTFGRGAGSRIAIGLVGAALFAFLGYLGILVFQTPNGTLVVEFDDQADIRVKEGELQIHDEQGALKYTLRPNSNRQSIAAGKYQINVTGVDGLSVDTETFEMKRGELVTVRVTAQPPAKAERPNEPALSVPRIPATTVVQFPGKPIINDEFDDPSRTALPIMLNSRESKQVVDGTYVFRLEAKAVRESLILPVVPYEGRVQAAAFATHCRATNGFPFINFCAYNDGKRNRFLSLSMKDGMWHLYLTRKKLVGEKWVNDTSTLLAFDNVFDPQLMPGRWIEVAARWGKNDYDLWLNGKHIAGGELPEGLKISEVTALQFCVNAHSADTTTLELDSLKVWDQSDLLPANAAPIGLPPRPQQ